MNNHPPGNNPDDRYWHTAETVCTPLQLETLRLRDQGLSLRQISLATDSALSTVRTRLFNADRKIQTALRKDTAA